MSSRTRARSAIRQLGLAVLAFALLIGGGAVRALAVTSGADGGGGETRSVGRGAAIDPVAGLPQFEIDGFTLRNVGPYSGMGAIAAVPCWRMGTDCDHAPSGSQVVNAIFNPGTTDFANAPITDPPQRYQLMFSTNLRTLLLGDGMPMDRQIVDRAARSGYEAIMVNWEHPEDPSLKHPITSLHNASHWAHEDGMKFGVAIGAKILLEVCPALGFSNCPTGRSPSTLIAEFKRERKFMLEVLRDTDVFTFELQWLVMLDQARWADLNLDLAGEMHRRAVNNRLTNFTYIAEMTTMHANHSSSKSDYPQAWQYLKSWRGIKAGVGPNTAKPIQGLFLLVAGVACDNGDCHSDPNPGGDDRVIQMARFLRTAFTVPAK